MEKLLLVSLLRLVVIYSLVMVVLLLGVVIVGVIAILSLGAAELIVAGKGIANVTKLVGKLL